MIVYKIHNVSDNHWYRIFSDVPEFEYVMIGGEVLAYRISVLPESNRWQYTQT